MSALLSFIVKYKFIFLFYLVVILFLLAKRKQLTVYAKFILLYRTTWGLRWMDAVARKFREWVILAGYIGVGAGFLGLIFISYILIKNLYDLATKPDAISGVSLVLPGINVPGIGVLPFWHWIIAIFVIAVVHEFAHGIVARAHHIPVKNTGMVFFGPILGAFVEPDEKKLRRDVDIKQYSVLAAGSFANVLLGILALLLLSVMFMPWQQSMVDETGFTFEKYYGEEFPFAQAGIQPGTRVMSINKMPVHNFQEFQQELQYYPPESSILVGTSVGEYPLTLQRNPDNPRVGFLGISQIKNEFEVREPYQAGLGKVAYALTSGVATFLRWLFVLSIGIGLFNLLPLPIVDGGRITQAFLHKLKGPETGEKRYRQVSLLFLLILLLNLFFPLMTKLF